MFLSQYLILEDNNAPKKKHDLLIEVMNLFIYINPLLYVNPLSLMVGFKYVQFRFFYTVTYTYDNKNIELREKMEM